MADTFEGIPKSDITYEVVFLLCASITHLTSHYPHKTQLTSFICNHLKFTEMILRHCGKDIQISYRKRRQDDQVKNRKGNWSKK